MESYDKANEIINLIKALDDDGIDAVVAVAKEEGMKFDADYLRWIIKDIRNNTQ